MQNRDGSAIFERKSADIIDCGRFNLSTDNFEQQFCKVYKTRLDILKERLLEKIQLKWGSKYEILNVMDLASKDNESEEKCIIIGTLYKQQELKPSILKEISAELQLSTQPTNFVNYSSSSDCLFIEDDCQRIKLTGNNLSITKIVTGIVCAVMGHDLKNGTFWVDDWCFPEYPKMTKPITSNKLQNEGNILLISGLNLANNLNAVSLNLLVEWIVGMLGNEQEQETNSKLLAIVIAGNSVRNSAETFTRDSYFEKTNFNSTSITDLTLTLKKLDNFLSQILENCHVILLPGEFDPSSHLMPQQRIHFHLLPKSSRYNTLHAVTNPWVGKIQSLVIAGSSGQPITDIMKLADAEDSAIEWMEKTLLWGHYAPTSPDTLDSYPYHTSDPFVIQECPDLYFAGNMEKFETKILKGDNSQSVRLVCVPDFSKTQTAVLVDLHTLNVNTISFGTNV